MFRSLTRSFNRRSPLKPSRWRSVRRVFISSTLLGILFLLLFVMSWILRFDQYWYSTSDMIVSLTSTSDRFHYELPFAIHSLLSQTKLPHKILIHLAPTSTNDLTRAHLRTAMQRLDASTALISRFDQRVHLRFEQEDLGPATKFIPIIKEYHANGDTKTQSQAIMICDDDQYYHPQNSGHTDEVCRQVSGQYCRTARLER